jgi:hypothetical protein
MHEALQGAEGPQLALLRRKRLARFDTQVPTFVKRSEREILALSGHSRVAAFHDIAFCELRALSVMLLLRPPQACARRYAQDSSSDSRQEPFPCLSFIISAAGRRL